MTWLVRRLLTLFGAIRPRRDTNRDDSRHEATLRRADRLLRVVHDYDEADEARRR